MKQAENQRAQRAWAAREREWVRKSANLGGARAIGEPVVILSAGHGFTDPGATHAGTREKDITTALAWATIAQWARYENPPGRILPVEELSLRDVVEQTNKHYAALGVQGIPVWALELHVNAGRADARGAEVIHYPNNQMSKEVGEILLRHITSPTWPNRGLKTPAAVGKPKLAWIHDTKMSAVILEVGFVTNEHERGVLTGPGMLSKARQIATGIFEAQIYVQAWFDENIGDRAERRV